MIAPIILFMSRYSLDIYRNSDIDMIIAGIPSGHKHLRLIIKSGDRYIVFQEATVAAIVRAYISIKAHPTRRAIKMVRHSLVERKEGYTEHQLIEVDLDEASIIRELDMIL